MRGNIRSKLGLIAGAAMAAALSTGAAHATTYLLTVDSCSGAGGCLGALPNAGSVTVTSVTGGLDVDIKLASGIFFNQAGQSNGHQAVGFDLTGSPSVTLKDFVETSVKGTNPSGDFGIKTKSGGTTTIYDPPLAENGTGSFNGDSYGFDWVGTGNNGSLSTNGIDELKFKIASLSALSIGSTGKTPVYFTVDVANTTTGNTGVVGATLTAVPEPATWGMMLVGFFGMGGVLRSRRRAAALTA